jgi:hypothetical protein
MLKFGEMDNEQNSLIRMSLISLKSGNEVIPSRFTWTEGFPFAAGVV